MDSSSRESNFEVTELVVMDLMVRKVLEKDDAASIKKPLATSVFYLVSRAEHARMWRRISHMKTYLKSYYVAAFERTGLPVNHSHNYLSLGRFTHGKFFVRIPLFLKAIQKCIQPVKTSDSCYAFSLDLLIFLYFIKCVTRSKAKLIYEIADIHPSLTSPGMRGCIMRFLERAMIRRCCAVVLTSPAFRSGYFADIQKMVDFPSVVIEHKVVLPENIRDKIQFQRPRDSVLVIGYIGLLKSTKSFSILQRIAEAGCGRIHIHFYGRFVYPPFISEECLQIVNSSPYLTYFGPYSSPDDLERIYTNVDIVWDAYYESENARWQRTTRFSEACFFKCPIIYNPVTQDGRIAKKRNLGLAMSFDDPEGCIQDVLAIDDANLKMWFENFEALPRDLVFYDREYDDLMNLIIGS